MSKKQRFPEATAPSILYDQTRKMNYFLDNNGNNLQLGQYYNRKIQVTGTLKRAGDTIDVQSIKKL